MEKTKVEDNKLNDNLSEQELGYVVGGVGDLLNKPKEEEKKEKTGLFGRKKTFNDQLSEIGGYLH